MSVMGVEMEAIAKSLETGPPFSAKNPLRPGGRRDDNCSKESRLAGGGER